MLTLDKILDSLEKKCFLMCRIIYHHNLYRKVDKKSSSHQISEKYLLKVLFLYMHSLICFPPTCWMSFSFIYALCIHLFIYILLCIYVPIFLLEVVLDSYETIHCITLTSGELTLRDNLLTHVNKSSYWRCLLKKFFIKISQNSQENTWVSAILLNRDSGAGVFLWILQNFKNTFFKGHIRTTTSVFTQMKRSKNYTRYFVKLFTWNNDINDNELIFPQQEPKN